MSGALEYIKHKLVLFLGYAYKTLTLYFLLVSVHRFSIHHGGWINDFIVFLMLSCIPVLLFGFRHLRHGREVP